MTDIQPKYQKDREVSFGLPTTVISSFITAHGREVGAFLPNEMVLIDDIEVNGGQTVIDATLYKQANN